jgi:hypothetical protein
MLNHHEKWIFFLMGTDPSPFVVTKLKLAIRVHNCYNGIGTWFYQALAGIRPDPKMPAYRHFFIDPQPVNGIDWLKVSKPTPYGEIRVEWENGELHFTVPVGTTATLFPDSRNEQTSEAGRWTVALPHR